MVQRELNYCKKNDFETQIKKIEEEKEKALIQKELEKKAIEEVYKA